MCGTIAVESASGAFTRMKLPRSQSLAALVALACALVQPATGHAGIAISLALGPVDGHEHAVSVEAGAGHLEIVISHGHPDDGPLADTGLAPEHASSCSEPDHVVHLGDEAPSCRNSKPPGPDEAPLSPVPFEVRFAEPRSRSLLFVSMPRSFAATLLRTVVLRL